MKIISFALWGNKPMFTQGMIENAKLAPEIYPDWKVRCYHDNTVPKSVLRELEDLNVDVIDASGEKIVPCMYRFLPVEEKGVEKVIFRDADSRISKREKEMVDVWEISQRALHIIRDHPAHKDTVLAGMFGMLTLPLKARMHDLLRSYPEKKNVYGADQRFIKNALGYILSNKENYLLHEDLTLKDSFIGQVYDENNQPKEWEPHEW